MVVIDDWHVGSVCGSFPQLFKRTSSLSAAIFQHLLLPSRSFSSEAQLGSGAPRTAVHKLIANNLIAQRWFPILPRIQIKEIDVRLFFFSPYIFHSILVKQVKPRGVLLIN